jgi:MraZ protein
MFIGEYKHSIDDKGRVAVPAKFRTDLSQAAVITRGLDHCLYVFTAAAWTEIAGKIKALPMTNPNARAFQRLMLAGAAEVELDTQGRALIPDYLREYAKLGKQTVIAGVYDRVEIWDEAAWNQYKQKTEAESDEIAQRLGELGI